MKTSSHQNTWPIHLITLVMMVTASETFAQQQDSTAIFRIETRDGNEYMGKIIEKNNDQIIIQTEKLGVLTIRMTEVVTIDPVNISQIRDHVYWFENPQSTRYLWAPNGYGLKKGEGYYQNIWVLFNQFSVGVTDHFSLGGGVIPLFLFGGTSSPVWFTPKISVPVKENKVNIGAGGLFGAVLGESDAGFGILYGVLTLGNRDKNLSLGLGYGYADGSWANHPAISVSAMVRTGPRGYLLTENYYLSGDNSGFVMLSLGGRRIIKKTGLDFGIVIPSDAGTLVAIPWLGLTVPFGKNARL